MKTTALQWAALCVCPPAVLATSVATIPAVKRMAHDATRGKAPVKLGAKKTSTRLASATRPPCDVGGSLPTSAILASLGNLPFTPGAGGGFGGGDLGSICSAGPRVGGGYFGGGLPGGFYVGGGGGGGGIGGGGGGGTDPGTPSGGTPTNPGPTVGGAVPEPQTWLLLIVGFATVGMMMRYGNRVPVPVTVRFSKVSTSKRRSSGRRRKTTLFARLIGTGTEGAATSTTSKRRSSRKRSKTTLSALLVGAGTESAATGTASMATLAAKTLLCVCPTAALVGTALTVPPVRSSIHAATAFAKPPRVLGTPIPIPCDPTIRSADATTPATEQALSNGPLIRLASASTSPALWAMRDGNLTQ